jgi:hypothetical protein
MQLQELLKPLDSIQLQQELLLLRNSSLHKAILSSLQWEAELKEKQILNQPTESPTEENFQKGYARALRRIPRLLDEAEEFLKQPK